MDTTTPASWSRHKAGKGCGRIATLSMSVLCKTKHFCIDFYMVERKYREYSWDTSICMVCSVSVCSLERIWRTPFKNTPLIGFPKGRRSMSACVEVWWIGHWTDLVSLSHCQLFFFSLHLSQVWGIGSWPISHRKFDWAHQTEFPQEVLIVEECCHMWTLRNLSLAPCSALSPWLHILSLELPTVLACTLRFCLTCSYLFLVTICISSGILLLH